MPSLVNVEDQLSVTQLAVVEISSSNLVDTMPILVGVTTDNEIVYSTWLNKTGLLDPGIGFADWKRFGVGGPAERVSPELSQL